MNGPFKTPQSNNMSGKEFQVDAAVGANNLRHEPNLSNHIETLEKLWKLLMKG